MNQASTAFLCLEALCRDYSIALDVSRFKKAPGSPGGTSRAEMRELLEVLQKHGMRPTLVQGRENIQNAYNGPVLARIDENSWIYVPFFAQVLDETMALFDPQAGGPVRVKPAQFLQRWKGPGLIFPASPRAEASAADAQPGARQEPQAVDAQPEPQDGTLLTKPQGGSSLPEPPPEAAQSGQDVDPHTEPRSTGLQCLCLVGRHHGLDLDERRLAHEHALGREEITLPRLLDIARTNGLKGRITSLTWKKALSLQEAFPVVAQQRDGSYVLLCNIQLTEQGGPGLVALLPARPGEEATEAPLQVWDQEQFTARCTGKALLLKRRYGITDEEQPFGFSWFIPEFMRHKGLFAQIALSVLLITCISLMTPLFFQIVIDKVLPHKTYTTLNVLAGGMIVVIIYNGSSCV